MNPLKSFSHKFLARQENLVEKFSFRIFIPPASGLRKRMQGNNVYISANVRMIMCVFICVTNNKKFTVSTEMFALLLKENLW